MNCTDTPAKTAMIVDDHPLFCDALSIVLTSVAGIATVQTADSLSEAIKALDGGARPDVLLLDLNLPDVNGLDGLMRLPELRQHRAHPAIQALAHRYASDGGRP